MDATLKQRKQELASALAAQSSTIEDLNAAMRELMKSALEKMLSTELDVHLESTRTASQERLQDAQSQDGSASQRIGKNRRNGTSPKTIQGNMGKLPLDIPRDRQGTFDPQLIPQASTSWRASMKRFWRSMPRA